MVPALRADNDVADISVYLTYDTHRNILEYRFKVLFGFRVHGDYRTFTITNEFYTTLEDIYERAVAIIMMLKG